jgi:ABC-type multidrug transport system ATPase subunit
MSDPPPSLTLDKGLHIGYSASLASFEEKIVLSAGTHFLLARNGRGKTTLLRTLAGTLKPVSGTFQSHGLMQYLPEDLHFDAELTPELIFRALLPKNRRDDAIKLAKNIELDLKKPYSRLSTGNRRKTNLIMAEFSLHPNTSNILLLDEPFSGIDAFARQAFEELWQTTGENVLRLVSCHPDYDSMELPSAILIESGHARHSRTAGQTWNQLKSLLN